MHLSARASTCSRRVSLESLKGTCVALGSARALMHMPSVVSDRLMLTASFARTPAQAYQPQGLLAPLARSPWQRQFTAWATKFAIQDISSCIAGTTSSRNVDPTC